MPARPCSLLTLAPYRFLPPANGGHLAIALLHEYLGRHCEDHIAGTADNGAATGWSFQLHPVFQASPLRYLPLRYRSTLIQLGLRYDATAVWCEHPLHGRYRRGGGERPEKALVPAQPQHRERAVPRAGQAVVERLGLVRALGHA